MKLTDLGDGSDGDRQLSSSVGKALALLAAFTSERPRAGVSELARATGLSKSTAFRLLSILVDGGFVERVGTDYRIGQRVCDLGAVVAGSPHEALRSAALPYLEDLYEMTHETVHLAVPAGVEIFYVEKLFGHNAAPSPSRVGGRLPAACSALGKAMMAYSDGSTVREAAGSLRPLTPYSIVVPSVFIEELRHVRETRVAFDREEARLGLTCVAAPILGPRGHVLAAVSVSGPTHRFEPERLTSAVRQAAMRIARSIAQMPQAS